MIIVGDLNVNEWAVICVDRSLPLSAISGECDRPLRQGKWWPPLRFLFTFMLVSSLR